MEEQAGSMEELVKQFRVVEEVESHAKGSGVRKEVTPAISAPAVRREPVPAKPAAALAANRNGGVNGQHAPAVAAASDGAGAEQWTSF